mmetsp:Transcript_14797/g.21898  ORF Transcript_14797/g.21898 Transcript_14797/m.21898 type:complete len:99 (-) Transcript_14797:4009-4305(-)
MIFNMSQERYRLTREKKKKKKRHVTTKRKHAYCTKFATVLSSQLDARNETISFDSDGSTAITDNSANAHIFNDRSFFVGEVAEMDPNTEVATIGGTDH